MGTQSFYIDVNAVLNDARQLHQSAQSLRIQAQNLRMAQEDLIDCWKGSGSYYTVRLLYDITIRKLETEAEETEKLAIALERIADEYRKAESNILGNMQRGSSGSTGSGSGSGSGSNVTANPVFAKPPLYGGNQGYGEYLAGLDEESQEFQDALNVLRQYDPEITPDQARLLFQAMNDHGCGYVSLANSIFAEFEGREDEFEKIFGFPYRDKNGNVNHNRLLLDIYATSYRDNINMGTDGFPKGTTRDTRAEVIENYLKDKGINVTCSKNVPVPITKEDYEKYANSGKHIIIGVHGEKKPDGSIAPEVMTTPDGKDHNVDSHAMYITGVTDDGKLIVSSWGQEFYIDQSELENNDKFMIVDYE